MKLGKFSGLSKGTLKLRCASGKPINRKDWLAGSEVFLTEENGYFYLIQGDKTETVEPESSHEALRIKLSSSQPLWSLTSIQKELFVLRSVEVPEAATEINLDIGVKVMNADFLYERGLIPSADIDKASEWLNDEFILEDQPQPKVFASVHARSQSGSFELRGREWLASINEINGYWNLSKLTRTRQAGSTLRVLQGNIRFVDASAAGQLSQPIHKHALEELIRSHGGYTQLWQQYSRTEWSMKVEAARHLGALSYKSFEKGKKEKEWVFLVKKHSSNNFKDKWENLSSSESGSRRDFTLEVMPSLPDWLDNDQDVETSGLSGGKGKPWLCNIVSINDELITLRLDAERDKPPPREGFICLSMHGDRKVIQRRERAVESIQQRNNPMPQLRFLLEGAEVPVDRRKTIKPLPAKSAARQQFRGEPTVMQKKALDIALNTPDIAIIIGPPGTGKTQVITALQTRLAEELKDQPLQHQMLVSSYQHDAVDNVMDRSNVFGLPAIKVGGKGKKHSDQNDNPVTKWCKGKAEILDQSLGKKLAEQPVFDEIKNLNRKLAILRITKPDFQERQIQIKGINESLDKLRVQHAISLTPTLEQQWQSWSEKQLSVKILASRQPENQTFLKMVRGLRTTQLAFADDGSMQCLRVLDWVDRVKCQLSDDDKQLLKVLTTKTEIQNADLQKLSALKNHLLDQLIPDYRPQHIQKILDVNECTLLDQMQDNIDHQINESRTLGYLKVLDEYLSALKHSPEAIREAALEYTSVLGATCQQAASEQMTGLKQVQFQDGISFDSVIVDEAARANPLDLMIPMAMAERRIVLVGDHRQLPHLLEPRVEDALAERFEFETVQKEMLNESLFKRLMETLKELENKGQPKRVVMLDKQFRMHPVLGKFISEQFYERYDLPEVKPGIEDESYFTHSVPGYEGKVCGWINVPSSQGKGYRVNGSPQRMAEAEVIAREARRILEECPKLNVGVITFYRSQVNSILKAMEDQGLTESSDSGIPKIKPKWQHTVNENGEQIERLRVGTVDAFQGKEFDVVLLSLVRTLPKNLNPENDDSLTKAYGFLRLDNRLNVAMSRQHRLLVMVGDQSMATHPAAEAAAPSLKAFYQLCRGNYGKLF